MNHLFDYQTAAARTAQPIAYSLDYLIPMIVGETGELFGQKAKAHWHGWDAEKLQLELVSEYGDICWGTAILLYSQDVFDLNYDREDFTRSTLWGKPLGAWQSLLNRSHYLHQWYSEAETHSFIRDEAKKMWLYLQHFCEDITGVPFEQVLQANVDKLASRAARGVLQGAGDHR